MTETTLSSTKRRIVVAMDTSPLAELAIEMAAQMADELRGEIEAFFYEDDQLLRLSGLPFVRETGSTSAEGRPLDPLTMQRRLQVKAEEIRRAMARQCCQHKVSWSLTTSRERAARHALQSARHVDLVVIGIESRQPRVSVHWREGQDFEHPLLVLYDGSDAGRRALQTGKRAAGLGWQVTVLPVAGEDDLARRLGSEALQELPTVKLASAGVQSVAEIVHAVQAQRGRLLVCPWESSVLDPPSMEKLVNELDCLIMLVR